MKINEVTKTKTAQPDLNTLWNEFLSTSEKNGIVLTTKNKKELKQELKHQIASGADTRKKINNLASPNPEVALQAAKHLFNLSSIDLDDIISDKDAEEIANVELKPVNPTTLPAIINKQIAAEQDIDVEFHLVKNLPGYLKSPIRALGRQLFGAFTKTPIEHISVIADLGGAGGGYREVNAVAGYLQKHGERDKVMELYFDKVMPGYSADVAIYHNMDTTYMLVKDFMGKYVYAWPRTQTKQVSKKNKSLKNK